MSAQNEDDSSPATMSGECNHGSDASSKNGKHGSHVNHGGSDDHNDGADGATSEILGDTGSDDPEDGSYKGSDVSSDWSTEDAMSDVSEADSLSTFTELVAGSGPWDLEAEYIDLDPRYVKGWIADAYARLVAFHRDETQSNNDLARPLAPGGHTHIKLDDVVKAWVHYSGEILRDTPAIRHEIIHMVRDLVDVMVQTDHEQSPTLTTTFHGCKRTVFVPPCNAGEVTRDSSHVKDPCCYYLKMNDKIFWLPLRQIQNPPSEAKVYELHDILRAEK